jgi:antitoxin VapB
MQTAKIFINGRSQAVRLPKDFRFAGEDVYIKKVGKMVILIPKDDPWSSLINSLDQFTDDFMESREQPNQTRGKVYNAIHARHQYLHLYHQAKAP